MINMSSIPFDYFSRKFNNCIKQLLYKSLRKILDINKTLIYYLSTIYFL